MCLLNYNKEIKKYKHLTYAEKTMIERWHNKEKKSNKEIAKLLSKSKRTIRREIKKGIAIIKDSLWKDVEVYSADVSNKEYKANMRAKGQELKIGSNIEIILKIENMIKEEKKSPEVVAYELREEGLIEITARTIRNYIYDGNVFDITKRDMIYKKEYKTKNKNKRIAKHTPPEKSIENRPEEANGRSEYGHWEGDLIIGKRKKGWVLLTLTERMTREEIIIKKIEKWLNNYPRAMFDYKSSNMLLLNI